MRRIMLLLLCAGWLFSGCGAGTEVKLVINELSAFSDQVDWFELYNPGEQSVDLSKWSFTDDLKAQKNKSNFQEGTIIKGKSYLIVHLSDAWPGFKLGKGEELGLYNPTGTLVDSVSWKKEDSVEGKSYGRFPDISGEFQVLDTPTKGEANKK